MNKLFQKSFISNVTSYIIDTTKHLPEKGTIQKRDSGACLSDPFTPMPTPILAEILRKSRPKEKMKKEKRKERKENHTAGAP